MLTILIQIGQIPIFAQTEDYFEGVLYYKYYYTDSTRNKLSFPIEEDEEYRDKSHILFRAVKGESLMMTGKRDIYLDSEKKEIYRIDHDGKIITKIKNQGIEEINPIEYSKIGEANLIGYACEIYFIKYVHRMDYVSSYMQDQIADTVSCTYYIAKDIKVLAPEIFAKLQGNHNSKIIDGRFSGIALKIIRENSKGTRTIIEATKVEKRSVQHSIKLPLYTLQK